MVLPVEKKISELEMGLLHLQQNIGIPEINLVIHPTVAQVSRLVEFVRFQCHLGPSLGFHFENLGAEPLCPGWKQP